MKKRASARKSNGAKLAQTRIKNRTRTEKIRSHLAPESKPAKWGEHLSDLPRAVNGQTHLDEIAFYRANEKPYGAFSNLYRRPIVFEAIEYPTAEHAYQAGKARKKEVRDWLLKAPTPSLLAMAAHGLYTWDIAPDWSAIKYDRMRRVLYAKFTQHEDLKQLLLNTGDARLVETGTVSNAVNKTWGEVNGKGLNMLGLILMEVRTLLRNEAKPRRSVHLLMGKPLPIATRRD